MVGKIHLRTTATILTLKLLRIIRRQFQEIPIIPFFILKEEKLSMNMEISKERLRTLIIHIKSIQILE